VEAEFRKAEQAYTNALAKLEQAAKTDNSVLDAQTAATIQKSFQVIDEAIAESRAALREDPESAAAQSQLFRGLRQKVVLLQETIALMNQMRRGDAASAAQIVDSANKS
jgi:hypothetical protein